MCKTRYSTSRFAARRRRTRSRSRPPSCTATSGFYCRATGRDGIAANDWNFYLAFNMFRGAATLQGIMRRVVDGTASSAHAPASGRGARGMAERGWQQWNACATAINRSPRRDQ